MIDTINKTLSRLAPSTSNIVAGLIDKAENLPHGDYNAFASLFRAVEKLPLSNSEKQEINLYLKDLMGL